MRFFKNNGTSRIYKLLYDLKKCAAIGVCTVLLRYFYVEYYLFAGERVELSSGGRCQLFFGGIPVEYGFDMIVVSVHMIIIVLETIILPSDVYNGLMDNMVILICRAPNRKKIYDIFVRQIIKRDIFLVVFDYILFYGLTGCFPCMNDIAVMVMLLTLILSLQFIYFILGFLTKSVFSYVWIILIYFLPVLFVGFSYTNGKDIWKIGKFFWGQYSTYNWFHKLTVRYIEYNVVWESVFYEIDIKGVCSVIGILMCLILFYIGRKCFKRIQML